MFDKQNPFHSHANNLVKVRNTRVPLSVPKSRIDDLALNLSDGSAIVSSGASITSVAAGESYAEAKVDLFCSKCCPSFRRPFLRP